MFPVQLTNAFRSYGRMGARRKHDVHVGVDFYCEEGSEVRALADGVVTDVFNFTGSDVDSPWWNDTEAVVLTCGDRVHVYGEVASAVVVGQQVKAGDCLGHVVPVLKKDKGVPRAMLHLELWVTKHYIKNFTWPLDLVGVDGLLDPLTLFEVTPPDFWIVKTETGYSVQSPTGWHQAYFVMAADSKAYCCGKSFKLLRETSMLSDKLEYTLATGRTLWFEDCKKEGCTVY